MNHIELRRIRLDIGITQKEMASRVGCSLSGYAKWESGVRQPRGVAIRSIVNVYELHLSKVS